MLKKLQLKLTIYYSIFISAILIAISIIYVTITKNNLEQKYISTFINDINSIYFNIKENPIISTSQFMQYTQNGYQIYIEDNGSYLTYNTIDTTADVKDYINKIKKFAKEKYDLSPKYMNVSTINHIEFYLNEYNNQSYYTSIAYINTSHNYVTVIILYPMASINNQYKDITFKYCIITIISILLLIVFSYFFIGIILKPVAEAKSKQNEFIASASHELRTPLTVILSSLSAILKSDNAGQMHHYEIAKTECMRMSNLIDDMLYLAKVDNHTWSIHYSSCNVEDIIIDCYNHFEELVYAKGLTFHVILPNDSLPNYRLDKNRITQLLMILTDNALSYTKKGSITLAAYQHENNLTLSVIDTGIGISAEEKMHIFNRFYSVDMSHSDRNHHGLGLCIAKEIIDMHGGHLTVNDTPGGGTTFNMIFTKTRFESALDS